MLRLFQSTNPEWEISSLLEHQAVAKLVICMKPANRTKWKGAGDSRSFVQQQSSKAAYELSPHARGHPIYAGLK